MEVIGQLDIPGALPPEENHGNRCWLASGLVFGRFVEEKHPLLLPGFESQTVQPRSLVAVLAPNCT